jgi:hypothetical protein
MDPTLLHPTIRALHPLTYIRCRDEFAVVEAYTRLLHRHLKRCQLFHPFMGFVPIGEFRPDCSKHRSKLEVGASIVQPTVALNHIFKEDTKGQEFFYFFLDGEQWVRDSVCQRAFLDFCTHDSLDSRAVQCLIFISTMADPLPPKVRPLFRVIEGFDPLIPDEILEYVRKVADSMPAPLPSDLGSLAEKFRGMTRFQISASMTESVVRTKNQDKAIDQALDLWGPADIEPPRGPGGGGA